MTSIGWYGPLIDLSSAASHVGDFVQLIVFVHRSTPVQYKLSKGGEAIRTDIQVGDETRPFFSVSLWLKKLGSMAIAGDVVLLQNVKIIKFGDVVEASTVQYSSLQCLIHPYESLISRSIDDLLVGSQVGKSIKEKLLKVIEWVQRTKSALQVQVQSCQSNMQLSRNWKVPKERNSRDCFSLSEVSRLTNSCKAIFNASVGEIFLPITWRALDELESEKMFFSKRLRHTEDNDLVEDLICTGCQLCGSPLDLEPSKSTFEQNSVPLYCKRSSNRLHVVSLIYRPFMLYVWDEWEYMPLLVKNKAAELLFGNIKAERVHHCYCGKKCDQYRDPKYVRKENHSDARAANHPKYVRKENHSDARAANHRKYAGDVVVSSYSLDANTRLDGKEKHQCDKSMNFYLIWFILLKILLKQGKNSPLKFEVIVNPSLDRENGRFEMVSVSASSFMKK